MKWTITRLKKFIKKGGEVRIVGGERVSDMPTYINRHQLRNMGARWSLDTDKSINSTNIDSFVEEYWVKWAINRISPNYYISSYYLNMKNYEEMKADALDSKNAP